MSLFNSFDRNKHLEELGTPLATATGVLTPTQRRAAVLANLAGTALAASELAVLAGVVAGTASASKVAVLGANKNLDTLSIADGGLKLGAGAGTAVLATADELNKLDDSVNIFTKGAGVSAMESYAAGFFRTGTLIISRFVIDMTGLVGSTTDLDIIGNTGGAASANLGQITAAKCGTLIGGQVTCLEVPAGGTPDIDFYSATESTGAQDALVTSLTEQALVTSGGAWTSGASKGMTLLPAANEYLYLANGAAGVPATFSAGKFIIELYGLGS